MKDCQSQEVSHMYLVDETVKTTRKTTLVSTLLVLPQTISLYLCSFLVCFGFSLWRQELAIWSN